MARYTQPKVAQLQLLEIPEYTKLERYRYRLTVESSETKKSFDSGMRFFDKNKKTIQVEIIFDTAKVTVYIYKDGEKERSVTLKHFNKNEPKINVISLKSTPAKNSATEKHTVTVNVDQGADVGWLLVKKAQTFDSLLRWVYKGVATHSQRDIFRHANAHLDALQDNLYNEVKPGQIVLITNKKHSPKLTEYKKYALDAERIYQILCKDKSFDPVFYANNFEVLMDFYNLSAQVAQAKLEYMKTVEGHKEEYCKPLTINVPYETTGAAAIYSEKTDKMFNEAQTKRVHTELVNELKMNLDKIQKAHAIEVKNKTFLANEKHYSDFRRANLAYYQNVEKLLAKDFMALHDNREYAKTLKNVVKDTSGVRFDKFQGGLKLSVARMHAIGSTTISLKAGGKIIFYLSAIESFGNVYRASQTGDANYTFKVTAVEATTLGGGAVAGSLGVVAGAKIGGGIGLVLAPFTGGLSIPVLGVVGAVAGGVGGGIGGTFIMNKFAKDITKVCD